MKLNDALNCLAALSALDGRRRVVKDGGEEKIVFEPYTFTGATRMAIARNIASLQAEQKSYEEARNGLIKQMSGGGDTVPSDKVTEFTQEVEKLLYSDSISLKSISESDLNLTVNPIPSSVIAALLPIIEDQG